jgi:hypothetical protein
MQLSLVDETPMTWIRVGTVGPEPRRRAAVVTAPDLSPAWSASLMNDLIVVGAAIWTARDAFSIVERRAKGVRQ